MGAFETNSGKVSADVFKQDLLGYCGADRKEIIQGPSFGVDTSVIDFGNNEVLCVSSDPLSLIPNLGMKVSAWLSVYLLANDICTTGFLPQYAQFVLNLPTDLKRAQFNEYWKCIDEICKKEAIAITGGHTGQVPGQNSSISGGGTMFLKAQKDKVLTSNGAKNGDFIVMTKSAALSSTSLLAMAFPKTVIQKVGPKVQESAADNFWDLSVLTESSIATKTLIPNKEINAMHDVTEGGVLGAINEMADASGLGFNIDIDKIPVKDEVKAVADLFEINPMYSIGAGSMIMSVNPNCAGNLISALGNKNIDATVVGELQKCMDKSMVSQGENQKFEFNGEDPYWAAFFKAFEAGWE